MKLESIIGLGSLAGAGILSAAQAAVPVPDSVAGVEKLGAFAVVVVLLVSGISALWWKLGASDKANADAQRAAREEAKIERESWRGTLDRLSQSQEDVARSVEKLVEKISSEIRTDLKDLARKGHHD